jgi:hypothetical protein
MQNAKCKMQIRDRQSILFAASPFRLGISLVEVLIAMGILTIGLLGVAALFPVGAFYMQKGDVADRGSAVAQAAFNEALARGVLNPENWLVWEDGNTLGVLSPPPASTFQRPFADHLRRQKAALVAPTAPPDKDKPRYTTLEFGSVFVIDPIAIAGTAIINPSDGSQGTSVRMRPGGVFPASTVWTTASNGGIPPTPNAAEWTPWGDIWNLGPRWPVRRVTLRQTRDSLSTNKPLSPALAEKLFSSRDDLAMDSPTSRDKPSIQRLDISPVDLNGNDNSNDDPLARQSRGDYSWIITVSPNTSEARDALATNPSAFSYEVSVVVFYKRPMPLTSPSDQADLVDNNLNVLLQNERGARAEIISTGLNGGEVLLTRIPTSLSTNEPAESPFNILKTGQWIMLCGPHPNSTDARPMMTARWYRVLAIDGKDTKLDETGAPTTNSSEPERRLVSLRGPQWPWTPAASLTDYNHLSNALYVCIPTGAVAVHSKTIHLGGSSVWDGGASGLTAPPPPGPLYSP